MNAVADQRVSDVLAAALKADREWINARFAEFRAGGHQVDGDAFLEHMVAAIDPLVCHVSKLFPERVRTVVTELCNVSLELFSATLLGPHAKVSEVADVWRRLLPAIPRLVARDPGRVAGCLCNAVYNISTQSGTLPRVWIERMVEVAANCENIATLLECGRILAWQTGMVQYRDLALEATRRLEDSVTKQLLGLHDDTGPHELGSAIQKLESNPWFTADTGQSGGNSTKSIRLVRTVGAFRGFGGLFLAPPTVCCASGQLFVSDGHAAWEMLADAYGTLLTRTKIPATDPKFAKGPSIERKGTVTWGTYCEAFPELASSSSSACDGTTLAVTLTTSHHVFLLAIL